MYLQKQLFFFPMSKTHNELWAECCQFIQDNLTPAQYNAWFGDISSESFVDGKLVLCVKSSFFVDQLEERYQGLLRGGIKKVYGDNVKLYYRYRTLNDDPSTTNLQRSTQQSPAILAQVKSQPANPFREVDNNDFDPQLYPRYTFENYCQSESNIIARTIAESIADNPGQNTFNPLFVFGPSGVGKTHLIQAIGIRVKERNPQARVLYVTARYFQNQYTAAAAKNINSFFHFYQSIDMLIIDDIQDLHNMPGTQNTFFHIFNHLHQHNRKIIMSSDCAPAEMEGFEERLLSRFRWGTSVELMRPDLELRREVLKLKSEQDGLDLPADVSEFIVNNVTQSVREIEGVVGSMLAYATTMNCNIDLPFARRIMANTVRLKRNEVNFDMLAEVIAEHFNISPDLFYTRTRQRDVSDPRQILMYLSKKLAKMSMSAIGSKLRRSHATVIYACNTIEDRLSTDKHLASAIGSIEEKVQSIRR